jgi:hypothetical protein
MSVKCNKLLTFFVIETVPSIKFILSLLQRGSKTPIEECVSVISRRKLRLGPGDITSVPVCEEGGSSEHPNTSIEGEVH